jgi:hypothetical protein
MGEHMQCKYLISAQTAPRHIPSAQLLFINKNKWLQFLHTANVFLEVP